MRLEAQARDQAAILHGPLFSQYTPQAPKPSGGVVSLCKRNTPGELLKPKIPVLAFRPVWRLSVGSSEEHGTE
ncbi:hypothetical protein TREES_T100002716 [Tupaia chinensis]|uniref:Uncharacterized protein n=1 Tax=Tupaia chinensis TaxID=246437 RepID=L9KYS5_TUPCH|nr:hypothetical protein TREES_T100002716 [Tupaia chinensis]